MIKRFTNKIMLGNRFDIFILGTIHMKSEGI